MCVCVCVAWLVRGMLWLTAGWAATMDRLLYTAGKFQSNTHGEQEREGDAKCSQHFWKTTPPRTQLHPLYFFCESSLYYRQTHLSLGGSCFSRLADLRWTFPNVLRFRGVLFCYVWVCVSLLPRVSLYERKKWEIRARGKEMGLFGQLSQRFSNVTGTLEPLRHSLRVR